MRDLGQALKSSKGESKERIKDKKDVAQVTFKKVPSIQESFKELEEVIMFSIIFCFFSDFIVYASMMKN